MTSQLSEFLKWAGEMERSANAFAGSGADLGVEAGNRKIAELLRLAAAIEGERDELLGGKILNQLVVHRLKTKLAALVEATAEVHEKLRINADGKATVTVGKAIALRRELGEALAAAKRETPQ